jgi:hypothetical protein
MRPQTRINTGISLFTRLRLALPSRTWLPTAGCRRIFPPRMRCKVMLPKYLTFVLDISQTGMAYVKIIRIMSESPVFYHLISKQRRQFCASLTARIRSIEVYRYTKMYSV